MNNMTKRGLRSVKITALLGVSAFFFFLAVPAVLALSNCPTQNPNGSIQCSTPNYWCGGTCQAQPTCPGHLPEDPYSVKTERDTPLCPACVCVCPADKPNDCTGTAAHTCQATNASCAGLHKASICDPILGVLTQKCDTTGCLSGYTQCPGDVCKSSTDPSCPAPGVWDPCALPAGTCTEKYILSAPAGAQIPQTINAQVKGDILMNDGNLSLAGGVALGKGNLLMTSVTPTGKGDAYFASTKAIRADGAGWTTLNFGNWGAGATGIKVGVYGQLCLNNGTSCASDWPMPLSGTLGDTLRHNGTGWIANNFLYNNGANIGIGTNAPAYVLDVRNNVGAAVVNINDKLSDGTTPSLWTGYRISRGPGSGGEAGKGTEKWFIGVDSSTDALQIRRTGTVTDLSISTGGYVTIGNATPDNLLRVAGLIDFNPGSFNTVLGHQAGGDNGGTANTSVGYRSAYKLAGASTIANTSIGTFSLYNNISGTYNTAAGYGSGNGITANYNAAYGAYALYTTNSGTQNTAVGPYAMYLATGSYSTAVGYMALNASTGSQNTAAGAYALLSNVSGNYNTAVGYYAHYNAASGVSNNTAIGAAAISQATGNENTAVGSNSLLNAGSDGTAVGVASLLNGGNYNTAIGAYAANTAAGGAGYNTFLGAMADTGGGALTYATAVGAYARVNASHALVLGGTGASYYANVGIGTVDPRYILDVRHNIGAAVININDRLSDGTTPQLWTGYRISRGPTSGVGNGTEKWFIGMNSTGDNLLFQRNGTTSDMVIDTGGHVGIGTSSPSASAALDVNGTAQMSVAKVTAGAAAGLVLTAKDATGLAEWKQIVYATDCTGGKFDHLTGSTYNGNRGGYQAANTICGTDMHVCTPDEILRSVYCTPPNPLPGSGIAWVNNGPPGFTSPAANDCNGWTAASSSNYGTFWQFSGASGGKGFATGCSAIVALKFACCTTTAP